jgi:hypothetical protein
MTQTCRNLGTVVLIIFIQCVATVDIANEQKSFLGVKSDGDDHVTDDASVNVIGYQPMSDAMVYAKYASPKVKQS